MKTSVLPAILSLLLTVTVPGAGATVSKAAGPALTSADSLSAGQRSAPLSYGAHGAQVLRAQVLLDRAHYASGEIDGSYTANLRQAIRGYQKLKQLPVSGVLDAATWAALASDGAPVLTTYQVTAADVAGPYRPMPAAMPERAKLDRLGYASIGEALGERFHASPALLKQLNPGKRMDRVGERILVPNVAAAPPMPAAATILVSRTDATLTLLDHAGMPFAQFPASTGSAHDPLPLGQWKVNGVARNPTYRYNPALLWDAKPTDQKATLPSGPNNPVGVVWIELSKRHYGIHGTPQPAQIGKSASHGCIRLTNWDALAVAQTVRAGVRVLLDE